MFVSNIKASLSQIVPSDNSVLREQSARLERLCNLFLAQYGDGPVAILRAPARINVLGEHIDYISYLPTSSLTFGSRERDLLMMFRGSEDSGIRSASTSKDYQSASFQGDNVSPFSENIEKEWLSYLQRKGTPPPHWQNYVEGAVTFARARFPECNKSGFDFAIDSTIPPGGGASSSSALVVAAGAAIREVNGIQFTLGELARDSAMAEWFIGTRGGSMDHKTICLAQTDHGVLINYSTNKIRRVSLPGRNFQWITFFSKPANKGREVMVAYNERAAVSRVIIPAMIESWKDTDPERFRKWQSALEKFTAGKLEGLAEIRTLILSLPETVEIDTLKRDYPNTSSELESSFPALLIETHRWPLQVKSRALHHLGEIERVVSATRILESLGDKATQEQQDAAMHSIGSLLNQSHASLRDLYGVSTGDVEGLMDVVRSDFAVFGARLMGGGFGGNVLALTTTENSKKLTERVQRDYYEPQGRDGVQEGSVIASTPGQGLAHYALAHLWREAVNQINTLGPSARNYTTNIRALIDSLPTELDGDDIWPVIVAAGKGKRAAASGLEIPKPIAPVCGQPSITHVLQSIHAAFGATRPPVIIVSPENEEAIRETMKGQEVLFVVQAHPLGTGDAVINAHALLANFEGLTLVVWSTQPVIQPQTFQRTVKLAIVFNEYEMIVPTAFRDRPYAPLKRSAAGKIQSSSETHLEGAESIDFGETNIGLFALRNRKMFEALLELRQRYWDPTTNRYQRAGGELGFPNELINHLAQKRHGVFASPIADAREEQGIKQREDLATCERFISELKHGAEISQ